MNNTHFRVYVFLHGYICAMILTSFMIISDVLTPLTFTHFKCSYIPEAIRVETKTKLPSVEIYCGTHS